MQLNSVNERKAIYWQFTNNVNNVIEEKREIQDLNISYNLS